MCAFYPTQLLATKACQLPPCYTDAPEYKFDENKCRLHSDWVATGEIEISAHDYQGHPLNKDFLTFVFNASAWEKGKKFKRDNASFTIGWCKNQIFPSNIPSRVRIYGIVIKQPNAHDDYQFLYIEPLKPAL